MRAHSASVRSLAFFPKYVRAAASHAVRVGPEEGLVQIDCQDFIFGKVMLQTVREDGFLVLALVAAFRQSWEPGA